MQYHQQNHPYTIRYALAGIICGLVAFASIKPLCGWMVFAGEILLALTART